MIVGGVDVTGPSLLMIHAHGSVNKLPFATMGSGSLAAMAVFESRYRPNMELVEVMRLNISNSQSKILFSSAGGAL